MCDKNKENCYVNNDSLKEIEDLYKTLGLTEKDYPDLNTYYNINEPIRQFSLYADDEGFNVACCPIGE